MKKKLKKHKNSNCSTGECEIDTLHVHTKPTISHFNKAQQYATKMCRLRQDVIDKAKAWKNFKGDNIYFPEHALSNSIQRLEKFEREGTK